MCPIRTEISTYKHLGKCIYFLFVWLAGICFRKSYFDILPNFGDLGGGDIIVSLYNQPKTKSFYQTVPPVYREAAIFIIMTPCFLSTV